jgi:ankyrin repeat protein
MWLGSTFAVLNGHFELAAYLLSKDANPNAFGVGYTPLPAAVLRGTEP